MVDVRPDLLDAQRAAWDDLARPGSWWTGAERLAIAEVARAALDDEDPPPPWVPYSSTEGAHAPPVLPGAAVDIAYRIARHAGTITEQIAREAMAALGDGDRDERGALRYVELCSIVSATAAVALFHRDAGLALPPFPQPVDGAPTGERPDELAIADLNWVPVAAPADTTAAVVQAYSAVPGGDDMTWRLAAAQYIPAEEMVHADWMRRADGLTRPEAELVAARVAQLRECFY